MMRRHSLVIALALAVAACGHDRSTERSPAPLYSPNAQPLSGGPLGQPSCTAALSGWFDGLDADHRGRITRDAFLADARTQFAAMDLDRDGVITPAELAVYRARYAAAEPSREAASRGPDGSRPGKGPRRREDAEPPPDQVDPVMIADVHLRNAVSQSDFLAHAEQVFASLDTDHDGTLSRAEALHRCPRP